MKISVLLFILIAHVKSIYALELRTGDILLQPLSCWSCSLIAEQNNSKFAHIGMVVKIGGKLKIAEAYSSVRVVELADFLKKTPPGEKVLVRRLDYHFFNFHAFEKAITKAYLKFHGNPYDAAFLWDNFIKKSEAIYCSELVYKVFNSYIDRFHDLKPAPMPFDINPDLWDRYFRGQTPRGKIGISPEDFAKSLDFYDLGEL